MDRLWSPWRYRYVSTASSSGLTADCIFCAKSDPNNTPAEDRSNYVLLRAKRNFVLLNLYPYTTGHLMVAPYEHVSTLSEAQPETLAEMMELTTRAEAALRQVYRPGGMNIGMNMGECAGAGVVGHIHMHVLPRWPGDASFMTTVGETRVLPEEMATTYDRVKAALENQTPGSVANDNHP